MRGIDVILEEFKLTRCCNSRRVKISGIFESYKDGRISIHINKVSIVVIQCSSKYTRSFWFPFIVLDDKGQNNNSQSKRRKNRWMNEILM